MLWNKFLHLNFWCLIFGRLASIEGVTVKIQLEILRLLALEYPLCLKKIIIIFLVKDLTREPEVRCEDSIVSYRLGKSVCRCVRSIDAGNRQW